MTFCSRTIAWADACVVNAMAAIAVSGISQNLARMVSSFVVESRTVSATTPSDQQAINDYRFFG
jgi:hypothetical protein